MKLLAFFTILTMFFIGVFSFNILNTDIEAASVQVSTLNVKNIVTNYNLDTIIDMTKMNDSITLFDFGIYDYTNFIYTIILSFVMGLLIYLSLAKYGRNPVLISLIIGFSYIFTIQYAISFVLMDFNWITTFIYFISCMFGVMLANVIKFTITSIYNIIFQ
ncbi:hypothetical protein RJG79_06365 [Mycoplasmatota bacterium WC44]